MSSDIIVLLYQAVLAWLTAHAGQLLVIVLGAFTINYFAGTVVERVIRRIILPDAFTTPDAEKKREDTLIRIVRRTARVLVWVIAFITILSEIGLNVGPVLAAAGIAGVALGFGGQYLIRDLVTGFFVISENQYRIGDVVCFGDTCGLVEDVTLRVTMLRDLDGVVHHIPHGEITKVSNLSKGFARVNLNIGVSYSANLEQVIAVVNRVGNELAQDAAWKEHILKAPQFLRVDDFADSSVVIKVLGDTKPLKQWDVAGELRKRLKIAFDKEGIEIPFPQRVIHKAS